MDRRKFIKSSLSAVAAAAAAVLTKTAQAKPKETGLTARHKRVTNPDKLEPGRMYYLEGIDGSSFQDGFATCIAYQGSKYFHQRIWADSDNNQAMKRWAIYKTNMIDSSYYDKKGEEDYQMRDSVLGGITNVESIYPYNIYKVDRNYNPFIIVKGRPSKGFPPVQLADFEVSCPRGFATFQDAKEWTLDYLKELRSPTS